MLDVSRLCGWVPAPVEVDRVMATLPMPLFADAAPHLKGTGEGADVFLWEGEEKVLGKLLAAFLQTLGTCFPAGTLVTMADGTEKPIESVVVGDVVLSHTGQPRAVTDTMVRPYSGPLVTVRLYGNPFPVSMTAEHPVFVVQNSQKRGAHGFRIGESGWQAAELLSVNDRVLVPYAEPIEFLPTFDLAKYIDRDVVRLYKHPTVSDSHVRAKGSKTLVRRFVEATPELCWLVGLYLAEGSCESHRVTITLSADEDLLAAKACEVFRSAFGVEAISYRDKSKSTVRRVRVNSPVVARFFMDIAPGGALTKRIPRFCFALPRIHKIELLRGWLDGDGHVDARHRVTAVTSSHGLARDFQRLAGMLQLRPSVAIRKKAKHQRCAATQMQFSGEQAESVYGVNMLTKRRNDCRNFLRSDLGFICRVKSVSRVLVSANVYNLEVEGDHSYIAGGLAVHNCVSQGFARLIQDLKLNQIAAGAAEAWIAGVATEPIYIISRCEVGQYRLGSQEGSLGSWAAKGCTDWGVLLRQKYGQYDFTTPNDRLAQSLGSKRPGLPDELEPITREHPVKTASMVTTYEQARDAIANLYGVAVCSDQGFTMQRDSRGICEAQGSWMHCMYFRGCAVLKGNIPVLICQQSWGDSPTGPDVLTLESGREVKLPQGCFGVRADVANRMLRQQDSFALSQFVGFKRQKPKWSHA